MRYCWRCSLIFDAEPVEIGRSDIDPNICIICADDLQRREENMNILTHTKQIKVHTIQIDDTEVLNYRANPESWLELLDNLLIAKPEPNDSRSGQKKIARHSRAARTDEERIQCPKCGMPVKPAGLKLHQRSSKCQARAGISTIPD